jgi:ABC-2 type transport system permease protein
MNKLAHHHSGFWARVIALTRKEARQLLRDPSNLAIGLALPVLLILLFGYGISLDVRSAPVAVVLEDASPIAQDVLAGLQLSPYLRPSPVRSMPLAQQLLADRKVDAILRVPPDFARQLAAGQAQLQLIVHGADASSAQTVQGYVGGAISQWSVRMADRQALLRHTTHAAASPPPFGSITVEPHLWFNPANNSSLYLVPGLVVLIMTLVGAFLTSLVVAREWERGTLEALFVTPVRPMEILLSKMIPYFGVGMLGFAMCLAAAVRVFGVPLHGSLVLLVLGAVLYMLVALGMGLLISSVTKNQFIASQMALLTSFLPALMLSGFLFDLNNVPAAVRVIGYALPATHFLDLVKTLMLVGTVWPIVLKDCALLAAYAALLLAGAGWATRKRLF